MKLIRSDRFISLHLKWNSSYHWKQEVVNPSAPSHQCHGKTCSAANQSEITLGSLFKHTSTLQIYCHPVTVQIWLCTFSKNSFWFKQASDCLNLVSGCKMTSHLKDGRGLLLPPNTMKCIQLTNTVCLQSLVHIRATKSFSWPKTVRHVSKPHCCSFFTRNTNTVVWLRRLYSVLRGQV